MLPLSALPLPEVVLKKASGAIYLALISLPSVSEVQFAKARLPTEESSWSARINLKLVQPRKASLPIFLTPPWSIKPVISLLPAKASGPMALYFSGITTSPVRRSDSALFFVSVTTPLGAAVSVGRVVSQTKQVGAPPSFTLEQRGQTHGARVVPVASVASTRTRS